MTLACTGASLHLAPDKAKVMVLPVVWGNLSIDPTLYCGPLSPIHLLRTMGENPSLFFSNTCETGSHDESIYLVNCLEWARATLAHRDFLHPDRSSLDSETLQSACRTPDCCNNSEQLRWPRPAMHRETRIQPLDSAAHSRVDPDIVHRGAWFCREAPLPRRAARKGTLRQPIVHCVWIRRAEP